MEAAPPGDAPGDLPIRFSIRARRPEGAIRGVVVAGLTGVDAAAGGSEAGGVVLRAEDAAAAASAAAPGSGTAVNDPGAEVPVKSSSLVWFSGLAGDDLKSKEYHAII